MNRHQINSITKAIAYFENYLQEEARIAEAAETTGYSLYHFCRLFNKIAKYSPFHYLIKRRISESAKELITTKKNISRIAFEYEFGSPEAFSRTFRRIMGCLPKDWRKKHIEIPNKLIMSRFTKEFLVYINQNNFPNLSIEQLPEIELVGIMETKKDRLEILTRNEIETGYQELYYISWKSCTTNIDYYFTGTKLNEYNCNNHIIKKLQDGYWLKFCHPGNEDDLRLAKTFLNHIWLSKSKYYVNSSLEVIIENKLNNSFQLLLPLCIKS